MESSPMAERDGRAAHLLALHRFTLRAAFAAGNIFAWLFIFQYLYLVSASASAALAYTGLFYALSQIVTLAITPFGGIAVRHGIRRCLYYATLAASGAFLWLGAAYMGLLGFWQASMWWGIAGFVALMGVYRALYWIPLSVGQELFGREHRRHLMLGEIALALIPFAAALAIEGVSFGMQKLLFIAAGLSFIAVLPIISMPDIKERFRWSYGDTFRTLLGHSHRRLVFTTILDGAQGAALLFVWPLTVFILVGWSYPVFGLVCSATLLSVLVGRRLVRRTLAALSMHDSPAVEAALVASAWVLRFTAGTPLQIIAIDTYYQTSAPTRRFGIDTATSEQAADSGHFVDEHTALKEMGLSIGRTGVAVLVVILALSVSVTSALFATLAAAALSAICSAFVSRRS